MNPTITIRWSATKGETSVRPSKDFNGLAWIERADCLKDAIYDLTEMYNETLKELDKMWEAKHGKRN